MVEIVIDGLALEAVAGETVLDVAMRAGIYIPTLCAHPDVPSSLGMCRLCTVEIEGQGFPTSCNTRATNGMVVKTQTSLVQAIRRQAFKAVVAVLPSPRLSTAELRALARYFGVTESDFAPAVARNLDVRKDDPLFLLDHNQCILCGRCVGVCWNVRGVEALRFAVRDGRSAVGPSHGASLMSAGCRFCGACAEVCPTGALSDKGGGDRPDLEAKLAPCTFSCPASIDVPRYVRLASEGRFGEALAVIREKVPFPAVLGRVCFHPCERSCSRREENHLGGSIAINGLKRFLAERDPGIWRTRSKVAEATGRRVAVVGSGPAGLTAAYYLAKAGHAVTVLEALPQAGGMLRVGIPAYRLPKQVLDSEIREISAVGVQIKTGSKVHSLDELFSSGFGAVFVATGAHKGIKLGIEGQDEGGVVDCVEFLRAVSAGSSVRTGRVIVIGGGDSAMDAARSALRLGSDEVTIVYRRSRKEMPADPDEVEAAVGEGVRIVFLAMPVKIAKVNGELAVQFVATVLIGSDAKGKPKAVPVAGSEFTLACDTLISAIGQTPDLPGDFGLATGTSGTVEVDGALSTPRDGVFAGGDVARGPASVIEAIADGRKAAISIDRYLGGAGIIDEELVDRDEAAARLGPGNGFCDLTRARVPLRCASYREAADAFAAIDLGFDEHTAIGEASRCLKCDLRFKISAPAPLALPRSV